MPLFEYSGLQAEVPTTMEGVLISWCITECEHWLISAQRFFHSPPPHPPSHSIFVPVSKLFV